MELTEQQIKEREDKKKERLKFMAKLNKDYDRGDSKGFIINAGENIDSLKASFLPTGILELDNALGGGFTRGAVACLYGTEFCGKTAISLSTAKELIDAGGMCLYVCSEPPFPTNLANLIGLDQNYLDVIFPQGSAEEIVNSIEMMLLDPTTRKLRKIYDFIVIDSINTLVPDSTLESYLEHGAEKEGQMARKAAVQQKLLEMIVGRGLLRNGAVLLLIAQARANMDANSAKYFPHVLSGARANKFDSKQIIKVEKSVLMKKMKLPNGKIRSVPYAHEVNFTVEKNATIGHPAIGQYTVIYGEGVDDSPSLVRQAEFWDMFLKEPAFGRKALRVPLENGDWVFKQGITEIRDRAKKDKEFKSLLKKELSKGKPKEVVSKGFDYDFKPLEEENDNDNEE